ncbi:MAG: hypothetical protein M3040_15450 [Bacteroidota bacterium]|nr:hypothetical protein [Bacteroidota bacterium]
MKFKILQLLFAGVIAFSGCTKETTSIQVVRHPVIKFTTATSDWTADKYFFSGNAQVVEYPYNVRTAQLYNRLTLQAFGTDTKGNNLQLILMFDATDLQQLTGSYLPKYTTGKGLKQVQIYNLNTNSLAAYALCDSTSSALQIQRQSISERLLSGTFQATVCNTKDSTQKIKIANGTFTDINY